MMRPSCRAIGRIVQPCTSSEASTMMKAALKISWPRGSPAISGRMREQQRHGAAQARPRR